MISEEKQRKLIRHSKSIIEWTEEDYREEGMLTRAAIAKNGHPLIQNCQTASEHRYDLAEENGILYLYCTRCERTLVLSSHDMYQERKRRENRSETFFRL